MGWKGGDTMEPVADDVLTRFFQRVELCHRDMLDIMHAKNDDYADADNSKDPFANFRLCERMGICSTERGILTRMSDKMQRLVNILDRPMKVMDEAIDDTLQDLANYAIILKVYREMRDELP